MRYKNDEPPCHRLIWLRNNWCLLANASLAPIDVKISPLISIDGGETDKTSPLHLL